MFSAFAIFFAITFAIFAIFFASQAILKLAGKNPTAHALEGF